MKAIPVARTLAAAMLTVAVAACATPRPAPPPPPRPAPRPAPAPPPVADWRDRAQSPGTWTLTLAGGHTRADFGLAGQPALRLACETPGTVTLTRFAPATAARVPVVVTTTAQRRMLDGTVGAGAIAVALPARDPLLDAMAYSRGRFMVEAGGSEAMLVPSWPEVSRVIEDCR
ncbi:hypothetical protein ACOYW6_07190 [Parablastomonas sp. CN1-191]|uniref:hypothetical protein n=1 Tax=Parablastomonas sp. CN1-191 TaxID=3400908 RepID=UPI003BF7F8F4